MTGGILSKNRLAYALVGLAAFSAAVLLPTNSASASTSPDPSGSALAGTTTVVSIHYSQTGYTGSTYSLTQVQNPAGTCGYTQLSNFTSGWNDNIMSTHTYGNCATTLFYDTSFGLPTYPIHVNASVSTLGSFNNEASSEKWCPAYACS